MTRAEDVLELFDLVPAAREPAPVGLVAQALYARLQEAHSQRTSSFVPPRSTPTQASAALIELELARRIALEDGVYRASV